MGMAASQARLLALQSKKDTQETQDFLNTINAQKTALTKQQTELSNEYYNKITQFPDIKDEASISSKAMDLYKKDNGDVTITQKEVKPTGINARAINAYKCFR